MSDAERVVRGYRIAPGADLSGADLRGANLRKARLSGANLRNARLCGADLGWASLHRANLYGADLYGANLRGADLEGATLYRANLSGADLCGADLRGAHLGEANLTNATGLPAHKVNNLASQILERITRSGGLDMSSWHSGSPECGMTHCLGGWAVTISPDGAELERMFGASVAGHIIFSLSCGEVPNLYGSNEYAMEWLVNQSKKEKETRNE